MTEKRIMSIAALLAGIGILLFGIASLIHSLRCPDFAMPRLWSSTYTSRSPMPTPMVYSQSYTNKLSPKDIAAMLNSLTETKTNFFTGNNDYARAVANAFATNEEFNAFLATNQRFEALGINLHFVTNAIIKALSRPEVQK